VNDEVQSARNSVSEEAKEGVEAALELLKACLSKDGFLASTTELNNYRRVWSRDGCIMGLAALATKDDDLLEGCRRTLETLASHQGPHGEIPSNVDPTTGRVSYGGTAGRVDADLWFVICCGQYWRVTGDKDFLRKILEPMQRVRFLLGAWEFNNRGLLYVPLTADWADEYVHNGYVLYDQLLYYQAQLEFLAVHRFIHQSSDHYLEERISRLKHVIRSNYWLRGEGEIPDDVYHEILFKKKNRAATQCAEKYWAPFFSPVGYGYRFDAMANVLASLFGIADTEQSDAVDRHISGIVEEDVMLLPAFHPVITPRDEEDWEDLQMTFSYTFKNKPHEYHNGGLWPVITGLYVADLAIRGRRNLARNYLEGIRRANALESDGKKWTFPEYVHGKKHTPEGTPRLGWSAAGAVIGHEVLNGRSLFQRQSKTHDGGT
jgi:hypothetical protein